MLNPTFALLDEPGVGKTPQALCAIERRGAAVVVSPSVAKLNWADEAAMWRRDLKVHIIRGTLDRTGKSLFRWAQPGELVVVNFESLPPAFREVERLRSRVTRMATGASRGTHTYDDLARRLERAEKIREQLRAPAPGTYLIPDEAQRLKNDAALVTLRFREMSALVLQRGGHVWPLTGSPLENNRDELWTVLQCAGLGTKVWGTHELYLADWRVPGLIAEKLRTISLRRTRSDVLPQLPPVIRTTLPVEIPEIAKKALDELVAAMKKLGVDFETASLDAIRTAATAAQVTFNSSTGRKLLATAKIPALMERVADIESAGTPLVVFCSHMRPLEVLGARPGWGRISGAENEREKHDTAKAFQAGKLRGVAVQTKAAGVAINLWRAWRAIFVDKPWTPAAVDQAEGRLRRRGQKALSLFFESLVADHPLERRVEQLLLEKQREIDVSVGLSAVPGLPAENT